MKTNEQIFKDIVEHGYITEKEIDLLKNRSQKENRDLFDYNILDTIDDWGDYGIPADKEYSNKIIKQLRDLHYTSTGSTRGNTPYRYREVYIIDGNDIEVRIKGFHDISKTRNIYIPAILYQVDAMECYFNCGKLIIIG